jgi:hypothetical protein
MGNAPGKEGGGRNFVMKLSEGSGLASLEVRQLNKKSRFLG